MNNKKCPRIDGGDINITLSSFLLQTCFHIHQLYQMISCFMWTLKVTVPIQGCPLPGPVTE